MSDEPVSQAPEPKQHWSQKALLYCLYGLIGLMVAFSVLAIKDKDFDGYQQCMQEKCAEDPEDCSKLREINNCCLGAGGEVGRAGDEYTCVFT
jgi:hypothetical protein